MDYSFLLSPFPSFYHILLASEARSFIRVLEITFGDLAIRSSSLSQLSRRVVLSREEIFPSKSLISRPNNNHPHVVAASCIYAEPSSFLIFTLRGQLRLDMASTRLLSSRFALCHRPRFQSYCIDKGKLSTMSRNIDDHKLPREQYLQSRLRTTIVSSS